MDSNSIGISVKKNDAGLMVCNKYRITVFTPTYNRAYIILNLYRSLKRQTYCNFEWLVIDDGSTDETEALFEQLQSEETAFPIRYYKQKNGGKCRAINRGVNLAQGELFFTVDSDDYLTDDALEKVSKWFAQIKDNAQIKGVVANRGYSAQKTVNYCFDEPYLDKTLLDIYSYKREGRQVFDGERAFVFYTEFHRKYLYPEYKNENFMTEAVVWNRMAHDGYMMRFFNDIIWVFEYQDDGLTKSGNSVFINNPQGYGLWLKEKAQFEHKSIVDKLKMYYTFTCDLEKRYDSKLIAKSIGAPTWLIRLIVAVRRCRTE